MAFRGGDGRRWSGALLAAASGVLAAALALGCASGGGGRWREGRFSDPELGGSLPDLATLEPGWSAEPAPDATLAFRHLDGSRASWLRECRGARVSPKALSRALWIALPGGVIEESAARDVAGLAGWEHAGRAQQGATGVRIATIARVAKRCEDSFLLVVPHAELHHREAFEAWVGAFADGEPPR
jgi:hypothetical protein